LSRGSESRGAHEGGVAREADATYSFVCTGCGKCCDSGPQLSLPELFHHQARFIGCLTLRRVVSHRAAEALPRDPRARERWEEDERAEQALAQQILYPLPAQPRAPRQALLLATQAFYEPGMTRCPELAPDNRCQIHHDRKPETCRVAPLDACVPDRLQHEVLAARRRLAAYREIDCIQPGEQTGALVTRRLAVVQPALSESLARRRADLAQDKHFWGDAVFAQLARDPQALARIPSRGFVSIPPAPLLAVLAQGSERVRLRCLTFVHAQLDLLERSLSSRAEPRSEADRASTRELHALLHSARAMRALLTVPLAGPPRPRAAALEAWLGLAPA